MANLDAAALLHTSSFLSVFKMINSSSLYIWIIVLFLYFGGGRKSSFTRKLEKWWMDIICLLRCTTTCGKLCSPCGALRDRWRFTEAWLQHWWQCFLTLDCSSSSTTSLRSCWFLHQKTETQEVSGETQFFLFWDEGKSFFSPSIPERENLCTKTNLDANTRIPFVLYLFKWAWEAWEAWSVVVEQGWSAKPSRTRSTCSKRDSRSGALRQRDFILVK